MAVALLVCGLIRGRKPFNWLSGVVLLLLLGFALVPMSSPLDRDKAMRIDCMQNLRQISLAVSIYREDHGGTNAASLQALASYCNDARLFVCPSSGSVTGELSHVDEWTSYAFRRNARTNEAMLFCLPTNHRNASGNIVFGDGSFSWYRKAAFDEVLKTGKKEAPPSGRN